MIGCGAVHAAAAKLPVAAVALTGPAKATDASPSGETQRVADWVVRSADNDGLPFIIVDKVNSRLFLFIADGVLRAAVPVLLGLARGDDSPTGIGTRKLSAITPAERITPAGRFVVEPGVDLAGRDILWIDYDAAIALHRAADVKPHSGGRSRVERLASPTAAAKRVSLGCVNVSILFYDQFIRPTFSHTRGIASCRKPAPPRSSSASSRVPA